MKVIIAGSRQITSPNIIKSAVENSGFTTTELVCGMARGVDLLGFQWAQEQNIPIKQMPAEWDKYGKSAGYRRNAEMAQHADALIAIWDGKSRGTKHMIDTMTKLNKPVYVYREKD